MIDVILASICIFKLFPKTSIKSTKLGGNIMDNINMIGITFPIILAEQFEYE